MNESLLWSSLISDYFICVRVGSTIRAAALNIPSNSNNTKKKEVHSTTRRWMIDPSSQQQQQQQQQP